jgi:alpha-beta hydrolase superfamily lysophospholipase
MYRRASHEWQHTVLLLGLGLAGAAAGPPPIEQVRHELRPLEFRDAPTPSDATRAYFSYYGLDLPATQHVFGTVRSGAYTLAVHAFVPAQAKATVVLVHGYYDHAGIWRHVLRRLVDTGYAVMLYDQPGHGLSDGDRASIGDFGEYVKAFGDVLDVCRTHLPPPIHVVGHSLGAGIVMDRLMNTDPPEVRQVVLLAPLIRSAAWGLSGIGYALTPAWVTSLPRIFRRNSSDAAFRRAVKEDPLQYRRVPQAFVRAHRAWAARMEGYPSSARRVTIIQGDRDTTVAWQYNLGFVQRKFPQARSVMIHGGGHQLMNERTPLRAEVLRQVTAGLADIPQNDVGESGNH